MSLHILNGPNLNRLGRREPQLYGHTTLDEVEAMCWVAAKGLDLTFRQTNFEGTMVEWIHEACDSAAGLIINPAGWSFYSVAVVDALKMFKGPLIELHITNIHARETMYRHSLVSPIATAVIAGLGVNGYRLAIDAMASVYLPNAAVTAGSPRETMPA